MNGSIGGVRRHPAHAACQLFAPLSDLSCLTSPLLPSLSDALSMVFGGLDQPHHADMKSRLLSEQNQTPGNDLPSMNALTKCCNVAHCSVRVCKERSDNLKAQRFPRF